jgi:hypothetical protein
MSDIKFKLSELVLLRDDIANREKDLKASLELLAQSKRRLNDILKKVQGSGNVPVILPKSTFDELSNHSKKVNANFNWKKIALNILKDSNDALTTVILYEKAKIKYPLELRDKVKSIHGFSSALSYLKNNALIEQKKVGNKFFYNIKKAEKTA